MSDLTPQQRAQLDSNIKAMLSKGASQDDVIKYSNDFKLKYDPSVKKKEPESEVDKALRGVNLSNATKKISVNKVEKGDGITTFDKTVSVDEYVPDEEKRASGKSAIDELIKAGYDKDFIEGVKDLPELAYKNETTSKQKLAEIYKQSPIKFNELTNEAKVRYSIIDAAYKNAHERLPEEDADRNYKASQEALMVGNLFTDLSNDITDFNSFQQAIAGKKEILDNVVTDPNANRRLTEKLQTVYAKSINPNTKGFQEDYNNSEFNGVLDINQYAGLKTLELFDKEKYNNIKNILGYKITPQYAVDVNVTPDETIRSLTTDSLLASRMGGKVTSKTTSEKIGLETALRELNKLGLDNEADDIKRYQYDLIGASKNVKSQEELDAIKNQFDNSNSALLDLENKFKEDDKRYPLTAELKYDMQLKEILDDRGVSVLGWLGNKFSHNMGTTVDAVENTIVSLFGSERDKAQLSLQRTGEVKKYESSIYLPESEKRENSPFVLKASKDLDKKAKEIVNGRDLSELNAEENKKLVDLVKEHQDEIAYENNGKTGTKNLFSKATGLHVAGFTTDLASFFAQMGIFKGLGIGAKLAEANALYTSTYGEDFNQQVANGVPVDKAHSHATLHGGIMALMVKFGSKYEAVQNMLKGGKSPLAKEIAGISKEAWERLYQSNKSVISRLGQAAKNVGKEQVKMVGTFGVAAPLLTDSADNALLHGEKSAQEMADNVVVHAKDMIIGSAPLILFGLGKGSMKYKANPLEKANIWELGTNPEINKLLIDEKVTSGELTKIEGENYKKAVDNVSSLILQVPADNVKGKLIPDAKRNDYLFNLVTKQRAKELSKELPEKQAAKQEFEGKVAEQKNSLIVEPKTEAQLLSQKVKLEKLLERNTGANVENPLNEKEVIEIKAELQAIEETLAENPKEPSFEEKYRKEYPTFKNSSDAAINDSAKENATDDPVVFIEKFGQEKFDTLVKDLPTSELQSKLDMLLKVNPDNKGVDILDKIIAEREALEPPKEPELTTEQKVKELETERDSEVLKLSKPEVKMELIQSKDLVNSKDPIGSKKQHDTIKEKYKRLKELIDCLHG